MNAQLTPDGWIYWRHKGDKCWSRSMVSCIDHDIVHLVSTEWSNPEFATVVCISEIDWKENNVDYND